MFQLYRSNLTDIADENTGLEIKQIGSERQLNVSTFIKIFLKDSVATNMMEIMLTAAYTIASPLQCTSVLIQNRVQPEITVSFPM